MNASGWPRAALLSLSDMTGAVEFAVALAQGGARLVASGGTARRLRSAGLPVAALEERTGFGELLGGRVKTLHPHVHAPILARRDRASDLEELTALGLEPIDLVAVTLYPFEERASALDDAAAAEEIDIGGVALLRAAAKNHPAVIVVHDPAQYGEVLEALARGVGPDQRRRWALEAFARTARYDGAIAADLARRLGEELPSHLVRAYRKVRGLRYGENPHQPAALYAEAGHATALAAWREGKELSYNNLLDLAAAAELAYRFEAPACVVVKHNEPCGAAVAETLAAACRAALRSDELSAYGGIVAFNRMLDAAGAEPLLEHFLECVAAPAFDPGAEEALGAKKKLRLVTLSPADLMPPDPWRVREAGRWTLVEREPEDQAPAWNGVTERAPSAAEKGALAFAWEVAAVARSNAIALAQGTALVGLGAGQTSRVDAFDVALMKARRAGHELQGAALASDGFLPFADTVEHAARAGIAAIVQPGGSMRDPEVIEACNRHGIAMLFTDRRTFRH